MRLYIHKSAAEKSFCSLNGKFFSHIYKFTSAIISSASITFCIFICENAPLSFQYRSRDNIFACNEFNLILLATKFFSNGHTQFRICRRKSSFEKAIWERLNRCCSSHYLTRLLASHGSYTLGVSHTWGACNLSMIQRSISLCNNKS